MEFTSIDDMQASSGSIASLKRAGREPRIVLTAEQVATRAITERRARGQWINGALFSDPAWEILLDLYLEQLRHGGCSLRRMLVGSFLHPNTAKRWLALLEEEGLVERRLDSQATGRELRLTDKGFGSLSCYLAQLAASWGYQMAT